MPPTKIQGRSFGCVALRNYFFFSPLCLFELVKLGALFFFSLVFYRCCCCWLFAAAHALVLPLFPLSLCRPLSSLVRDCSLALLLLLSLSSPSCFPFAFHFFPPHPLARHSPLALFLFLFSVIRAFGSRMHTCTHTHTQIHTHTFLLPFIERQSRTQPQDFFWVLLLLFFVSGYVYVYI